MRGCHHYIPLGNLEAQVVEELGKIKFSQEFTQTIINRAKELVNHSRKAKEAEMQDIRNAIKALEIKRSYLEDKLLDHTVD